MQHGGTGRGESELEAEVGAGSGFLSFLGGETETRASAYELFLGQHGAFCSNAILHESKNRDAGSSCVLGWLCSRRGAALRWGPLTRRHHLHRVLGRSSGLPRHPASKPLHQRESCPCSLGNGETVCRHCGLHRRVRAVNGVWLGVPNILPPLPSGDW